MNGIAGVLNNNSSIFLQRDEPPGNNHSGIVMHAENRVQNASFNFRTSMDSTDELPCPSMGYGDYA